MQLNTRNHSRKFTAVAIIVCPTPNLSSIAVKIEKGIVKVTEKRLLHTKFAGNTCNIYRYIH